MFSNERYTDNSVGYNFCGNSGVKLPRISLGFWHNFGDDCNQQQAVEMMRFAFDHGITHFDLANNYGVPYGSAERNFGKIIKSDFADYRDELFISTKAGHEMWAGPYGNGGSRKSLMASIDQSLRRMQLDYVDLFYSHRYDPETPLEETMDALSTIVKQGKALYVGLSKYPDDKLRQALLILKRNGTPCLTAQYRYNIINREIETDILPTVKQENIGMAVFSPLAQGVLSDKYINSIPQGSRITRSYANDVLRGLVNPQTAEKLIQLQTIADRRGQSIAQMALAWCLQRSEITSVIVGASSVKQLSDNIKALKNTEFSSHELLSIEKIF